MPLELIATAPRTPELREYEDGAVPGRTRARSDRIRRAQTWHRNDRVPRRARQPFSKRTRQHVRRADRRTRRRRGGF